MLLGNIPAPDLTQYRTGSEKAQAVLQYACMLQRRVDEVLAALDAGAFKTKSRMAAELDEELTQAVRQTAAHQQTPASAYPVGAVYMSVNDRDPAQIFGGVWQKINDIEGVRLWARKE